MIEAFAAGGPRVGEAIRGLSREDLLAPPAPGAPGKWTIQEIVLHLLDSDLVASERMKRIIAMDRPALIPYDENAFVERLAYDRQDAAAAAEMFALNRALTASILRSLPDEAFAREGIHSENGPMTLARFVDLYVWHVDHHLKFLREKRARLGKALAQGV